jgi:hypothetical protein
MERAEEAGSGVEIGAGAQDVGRIGAGIGEQCFALGFITMTPDNLSCHGAHDARVQSDGQTAGASRHHGHPRKIHSEGLKNSLHGEARPKALVAWHQSESAWNVLWRAIRQITFPSPSRTRSVSFRENVPTRYKCLPSLSIDETSGVQSAPWGRYLTFSDPDGNGWVMSEAREL